MRKVLIISASVLGIAVTAGGSYWLGTRQTVSVAAAPVAAAPQKILFYRNPMGLPDTSPVPKKDEMGMDYVPVYAGEQDDSGAISLSVEKMQKLGVKTEVAALRELGLTLRLSGRVEADERRIFSIAPKFEGWVEKLYVNTTGQLVSQGQPLFEVYSPELVSTQREYALAKQGESALQHADREAQNGMQQLAAASLARLQNWGISGNPSNARTVTFRSPVAGIVMDKKAVQGMRFGAGDTLYQIADLSTVWVLADIAEQDAGRVHLGDVATVSFAAYPGESFHGKVSYVYPTLNATTRTAQARIELANPSGRLKPALFANVELQGKPRGKVLSVPDSAIIDSGTRQVVLVQPAPGRFEPRTVKLGQRGDHYVEVLAGVGEGEPVVVSANFLIDSESNLRAALSGMTAASAPAGH